MIRDHRVQKYLDPFQSLVQTGFFSLRFNFFRRAAEGECCERCLRALEHLTNTTDEFSFSSVPDRPADVLS